MRVMGENYGFCWAAPVKYSFAGKCWQNTDLVRLAFGILKCSGATKANTEILPFDYVQGRMTNKNRQRQIRGFFAALRMTTPGAAPE
jgi:hypothetical protein